MQDKIADLLFKLDQSHLLHCIDGLLPEELEELSTQLEKYDPYLPKLQKVLLKDSISTTTYSPCLKFEKSGNSQDLLRGEALLREGKVGCLILAGGQGTRLGVDGPKGAVPVTAVKEKSLFQLFCERCTIASQLSRKKLPLCIMTSPLNHQQTVSFFEEHHHFGLDPAQLSFFEQEMLPFMDDSGNWLLEKRGKIAEGPDGNGHALRLFFETGIWQKWQEAGIEYVNVIFVDNSLADPFDPEFIGFTAAKGVDAALKAIERQSPDEKMGLVAELDGKLKVIEYSEAPSDSSAFTLSSTGMFCLRLSFIEHLSKESPLAFPLHLARKAVNVMDGELTIWKCERFIFDLLNFTTSSAVLVCPREKIYAPLKNASGEKSLETVKKALLLRDKEQYLALTGRAASVDEFELDPSFYYPTQALKQWLTEHALSNKSYVSICESRMM